MRTRLPILLLTLLATPLHAQTVGDRLGTLSEANARGYISSLARGVGHALASRIAQGAQPLNRGRVRVGVHVTTALFDRGDAAFNAVPPANLQWNGVTYDNPYEPQGATLRTPTAVGKGTGVTLVPRLGSDFRLALLLAEENPNSEKWTLRLPDGFDLPAVPLAFLEASVGLGAGTEISARYLPSVKMSESLGSVGFVGASLLHDLDRHLATPLPLEVAAVAAFQSASMGEYLDETALSAGFVASRSFVPIDLYAAAMVTRISSDVTYTADNPTNHPALPPTGTPVSFSVDAGTRARLALGAGLDLVFFRLTGEFALAEYRTFTLGITTGLP
ncbi:MAG: DUF6588 family protein [Gemmatimonadota bacterium]